MMEDFVSVKNKLMRLIDFNALDRITVSNPLKKDGENYFKVTCSRILIKGMDYFQFAFYIDKKVIHENIRVKDEDAFDKIVSKVIGLMEENFKQCDIISNKLITVLMNKKRRFNIVSVKDNDSFRKTAAAHNSEKNYILKDGVYVEWMYKLGMMDKNGIVLSHMQKKFRQINRFLEMVDDVEKYLPDDALIVDMGCGKSYLTFAMYYYFNDVKSRNVKIMGFDLKKDVVENCGALAKEFGFDGLEFFAGDIADIDAAEKKADMIITLHACDTATDYAIAHAVKWGCRVIMSVPCCQHELFGQIQNETLKSMLSYGILKERFSALLTDTIRAETLRMCGYKTNVLEFIDMEHTPKNIMIRAVKKHEPKTDDRKKQEYMRLIRDFHADPAVYRLLKEYLSL